MQKHKSPKGVALLITVVVIGITGFAVMAFLARSGIISTRNTQLQNIGIIARNQVFGCVDEVMAQHLRNPDFNQSTVTLGFTDCTITILDSNPNEKTLELEVSKSNATQIIQIITGLTPVSLISIE
ncbi:MAG: hypothetical protein UU40_C0002G0013 [Candidatus Uhrbacteria bacterium GW2011_GWD2_41_121]|uniref:Uncharacterized protein n=1 Tax=Candidatus Uhrbacteria bacterium GW2011_GWC1_41_20 TaxID=1618983 RepID=A0A0G0VJP7_9BACT|nr:MAG: hypothetical protein UT52_C0002G0013 [Candidatus Uhrbacteria bacterium GW2011_GWE1_39_46]KKR64496.1 MAG: hypothetical protein UU04_C0001G0013 [Candidatus Uhrbacteria bacterium GW2011_GWC2_40_450]KKR90339.1 MAG: hypothetical protein UU36_C0007G0011 [Candidatus Uhrbacteria bacterium GW2011_GWE2_41_1153]KKR90568.1 MAG: hypothetical protein UU40_C0002G0013 [Candidatus Uhrbacteria bacterium GW2011_GWD2_41_121]KKR96479.1 MAG: hypothetical protein UU46_C0002G0015 [Candidatus Uhrbacteria bacter